MNTFKQQHRSGHLTKNLSFKEYAQNGLPALVHIKEPFFSYDAPSSLAALPVLQKQTPPHFFKSSIVLGFVLWTYLVAWLQKEKSRGDKSGEYGGQWCSVFLEIIRPLNFSFKKLNRDPLHGSWHRHADTNICDTDFY